MTPKKDPSELKKRGPKPGGKKGGRPVVRPDSVNLTVRISKVNRAKVDFIALKEGVSLGVLFDRWIEEKEINK